MSFWGRGRPLCHRRSKFLNQLLFIDVAIDARLKCNLQRVLMVFGQGKKAEGLV
jgi:hypothetical protein